MIFQFGHEKFRLGPAHLGDFSTGMVRWKLVANWWLERRIQPPEQLSCFHRYSSFIKVNAKPSRIAFKTQRFDTPV